MRVAAIIAEYNPFHNGHAYQIDKIKESLAPDFILSVMSGNFVERGEPAIIDKFFRAKTALENGVDLVIELAPRHALLSAEGFATSAVSLIKNTGVATHLCFSVEFGDINLLFRAKALVDGVDGEIVRAAQKRGLSYPNALFSAISDGEDEARALIAEKNAILGIEYLRAIEKLEANLDPFLVQRMGVLHDAETPSGAFASASYIRNGLLENNNILNYIPNSSFPKIGLAQFSDFSDMIMYRLLNMSRDELLRYRDVSEGLENIIFDTLNSARDVSTLLSSVKSKRYTMARLKRIILRALLFLEYSVDDYSPSYIRVLAVSAHGLSLLPLLLSSAHIPVIIRADDILKLSGRAIEDYKKNELCDKIYALKTGSGAGIRNIRKD